jgi:outer membrane lipopolysaccharide assembly protein LptE/RlpB
VKQAAAATIVILVVSLAGCGYHFIGQESGVLSGIHSIAIPYFVNKSFEPGLERYVTEALVDEFVKSKFIKVVDEAAADAVIRGRIEEFSESVISFDKDDRALEYRTRISLDITLERKDTAEILWRNKGLYHFEEYTVSSDIATTEANKKIALKMTAAELAERIHDSIIEGF